MTERGYLGEVLEELRLERGMSLRALATQAGLSVGYLSALESGKQKNPSLEALRGLASALGVSITVSRDEPGYIRVSEGSPPCVSWVRSGVPTVREEIEEAKEEGAMSLADAYNAPIKWRDWRSTDDASLWPTRMSVDVITALRERLGPTPWHQMYQGVPPERGPHEDWDAMKAAMDKDPALRAMWRRAPMYEAWKAAKAEAKTYEPGAEGYQRVYVEVAPCQAVETNTEPVVVGHAIGVDLAGDDRLAEKLDLVQKLRRGPLRGYISEDAEAKVWGAIWDKIIQKPATITNEPGPVPEDAIVASGEGLRVSEVGKWPADYKAPSGGMAEGAVAIGVDLAHGPGKAVTTVWRVQDGKFEMAETVEDPLAKAVELLDAIRGQVGEGDSAESFKMRLAQRVAQELVDLLRWSADRVDQRTENGRRARLHNNAMVSMLAFNDDFTAWREDVMVASGKRRDPDAGKKRSE